MGKEKICAKTPPMGWNSWDCYGASVNEEALLGNARYMSEHLKEYGWEYIICDIQWYESQADSHEYHKFAALEMDEYSRLIPSVERFPSSKEGRGFGPIAEQIHDMGLKFGIHIMRGIPRQAVHSNTKILGSGVSAKDIAHPASICMWNTDMYGIDACAEGAQEYYDSIFKLYSEWGVDFVKVDDIARIDCGKEAPGAGISEITLIRNAIDKCGREIVLSLSPGPARIEQKEFLTEHANMWRMTDDFWDRWEHLYGMFERCQVWEGTGGKGHWPDCDMLPLGHLCLCNDEDGQKGHYCRFTKDEQKVMMTLWCIFRSPLFIGAELRDNDDFTLWLLTNKKLLEMHRYGRKPRQVVRKDDMVIWSSKTKKGRIYIAVFNIGEKRNSIKLKFKHLGLDKESKVNAEDIWTGQAEVLRDRQKIELGPHMVKCFEISFLEGKWIKDM